MSASMVGGGAASQVLACSRGTTAPRLACSSHTLVHDWVGVQMRWMPLSWTWERTSARLGTLGKTPRRRSSARSDPPPHILTDCFAQRYSMATHRGADSFALYNWFDCLCCWLTMHRRRASCAPWEPGSHPWLAIRLLRVQAVGEVPEDRRGAAPMDTDAPSTSQENSAAQAGANGGAPAEKARWQRRGLSVLTSPYVKPLAHQEVHATMRDGAVPDWDRWECVVHTAVRCAAPMHPCKQGPACTRCHWRGPEQL